MQDLIELWKSRNFQIFMDMCRITLIILAAIILAVLISNIHEVKILNSDVCKLCMNKTGCQCWCGQYLEYQKNVTKKIVNIDFIDYDLNVTRK